MLKEMPVALAVVLVLGLCASFYEGHVGACLADGGPFRGCTAMPGCVSCSAGIGANLSFISDCSAAGGSVTASDVQEDVCY